jgi:uncharacterized OsmC-like protein
MHITSSILNNSHENQVKVETDGNAKVLAIPSKPSGKGSSVNGGELLFTALATCFCNDLYREAAKRLIEIKSIEVTVSGEFGGEGEPASHIQYQVKVISEHPEKEIADLVAYVDKIAEVHNTLRVGTPVTLKI